MNEAIGKRSLRVVENSKKKRKWYSLMDKLWDYQNLEQAFYDVKKNRGSHGVDKVTIKDYEIELEHNLIVLQESLRLKTYRAKPVRRVFIPKADGTKRPLGIPTVEDRILQAATKRILEPIFEQKFLNCSFGFRPNRSAHMAIDKIRQDLMDGYSFVIDADIKTYFDSIPHDKLIDLIKEEVVDSSVLALIVQFLKSGILENGILYESDTGSSQGGVISPLLANIYLHPLDEMMMERGHRITRYADDFVICCKSRRGAERVLRTVVKLLEEKLGLKVHPDKTKIVDNYEEPFIFLGYVFKKGYFHSPSDKAVKKFKKSIKDVTKRNLTVNLEEFVNHRLNPIIRGWGRYFGIGFSKTLFQKLDSWIRRRLRMIQLRSWRKIRKLHRELRKRNWKGELPHLSMTRWRNSKTKHVHFAIPIERFREIKLVILPVLLSEKYKTKSFMTAYEKVMATHKAEQLERKTLLSDISKVIQSGKSAESLAGKDLLPLIIDAVLSSRTIETIYHTQSRNSTTTRKIDPYFLMPRKDRLYIIGYDHKSNEIRTFRLSRFQSVKVLNKKFTKDDINIEKYLQNTWSIIRGEKRIHFKVKFSQEIARYIKEEEYNLLPKLTDLTDGSLLFEVTVNDDREILKWIMQYGPDAEIIEPEFYRLKMKEMLQKWTNIYQ